LSRYCLYCSFVFLTFPPPTALYTLSLHDALPIYGRALRRPVRTGFIIDVNDVNVRHRAELARQTGNKRGGHIAAADESNRKILRSEEHTSELQSRENLVCRLLLEKKKKKRKHTEA